MSVALLADLIHNFGDALTDPARRRLLPADPIIGLVILKITWDAWWTCAGRRLSTT